MSPLQTNRLRTLRNTQIQSVRHRKRITCPLQTDRLLENYTEHADTLFLYAKADGTYSDHQALKFSYHTLTFPLISHFVQVIPQKTESISIIVAYNFLQNYFLVTAPKEWSKEMRTGLSPCINLLEAAKKYQSSAFERVTRVSCTAVSEPAR
jgi:hypothetical protein